jgi:S1-C subfamily serine protease
MLPASCFQNNFPVYIPAPSHKHRAMMTLTRLVTALLLLLSASFVHAEEQDVAATVRGVVRIVIVATNGKDSYFVGHASGFAVAADKVLTNAHVVEMLRTEPNLILGIVPSQGKQSFGGKVVAYSPRNDLALIQLNQGSLPVSTFFAGSVQDGQRVTAIGYPGSVDRAQGLDLSQVIQPMTPVKTSGTISSGRPSQAFDTILHTAPMAQGNSGGPLVDDCGRVLGVNSFGALSNGDDAEFGFAEVASFLRQAGVQFLRSSAPCRSIADLDAAEAMRSQQEAATIDARERAQEAVRQKKLDSLRASAEQDVIASRENMIAIAAVLLSVSVLALGACGLMINQGKKRQAIWSGIGGGVMLLGAITAFAMRPSFTDVEDRVAQAMPVEDTIVTAPAAYDAPGDNICHIDEARSRITVSDTTDVPLNWQASGCVNGATQYGRDTQGWSRILVPANDPMIAINSFNPDTGIYRTERFLADAETLQKARTLRNRFTIGQCTSDEDSLTGLSQMQAEIRAILPPHPNERLVYKCVKGLKTADGVTAN